MRMPQSLQENKGISAPWVNSSNNSSDEKCAPTLFKAPTARFAVSSTAVCGEPNFQRDATTACWIAGEEASAGWIGTVVSATAVACAAKPMAAPMDELVSPMETWP